MKVGIATVQVPFISGGAEIHARLLKEELIKRNIEAEIITMPFKWYPASTLLNQIQAANLLDLTEVAGVKIDRLITMKFPLYYANHPNKVGWILHQHRQAYELYDTKHSDLHTHQDGQFARQQIHQLDAQRLPEHKHLFTNSKNVAERMWRYNRVKAEALYHPPEDYDKLYCENYEPYILVPGRLDDIKRQQLIVEAIQQHPKLRLIIIGNDMTPYGAQLKQRVETLGLASRVEFKGFVSREEKAKLYANALAIYNGALEEDYGYLTLEGFFSSKPVISHTDSGGPLEFIDHQHNGIITEPSVDALASALSDLSPVRAQQMGHAGRQTMIDLKLNWDNIIETLLR